LQIRVVTRGHPVQLEPSNVQLFKSDAFNQTQDKIRMKTVHTFMGWDVRHAAIFCAARLGKVIGSGLGTLSVLELYVV
jgi:hypothetical protein